jgi:hypothetical protein
MTVPFHWDHSHGKIVVIKTYKTLMKIDSTNNTMHKAVEKLSRKLNNINKTTAMLVWQVKDQFGGDRISLILGIESGSPIEGE